MTIIDKLKLDKYKNLAVLNEPDDYHDFQEYVTALSKEHDAIFIFIETIDEMVDYTQRIINEHLLLEKGYLFFAYPKKGNKRYETYIHRDEIFPALKVNEDDGYVNQSDLKFSRMVSMDDIFTVVGLKRESTKSKSLTAPSQRVTDYEDRVKDIEKLLIDYPNELKFYKELTEGYRRDWARYIFSAKQQKTRDNRQTQMIDVLSQGYKSINLYRQNKK